MYIFHVFQTSIQEIPWVMQQIQYLLVLRMRGQTNSNVLYHLQQGDFEDKKEIDCKKT